MLNTLAAHALVLWSERRSTKVFLGAVLGGMAGRMALMLAAVVVGVLGLGLPRLPLVASLLGYFVLFLVLELTLQHRHAGRVPATR
jgi:branched-subunit amino acid ABC-type transport system permease component